MVSEVGFKQDPLNGSEAEQELVPTELAELTTFLLTLAFESKSLLDLSSAPFAF